MQLSSRTDVNRRLGIAFTNWLLIPWNSLTLEVLGCSRLIRCLRTKKHVASTADIASRDMKEMAIIDHAEFSIVGIIHSSISLRPAYFFRVSPENLEMKTAFMCTPPGVPAIETKEPPSSLSYTIAALNPALCAILTLSSNAHPPLIISTNGESGPSKEIFFNRVQALSGSAIYKVPQ